MLCDMREGEGGYGFHPVLAYCDETSEALAGLLRPGNASTSPHVTAGA